MRRFGSALSVCLAVYFSSVGCGGSSSETPPPLEPDPTSFRYTGPRMPSNDEPAAAAEPAPLETNEEQLPPAPGKPAAPTWGSGKTPPAPAPSLEQPKR